MPPKKSIHWRKMMGERVANDDGFTYNYGAVKGYTARSRHSRPSVKDCIRIDKRQVRTREMKDALSEME